MLNAKGKAKRRKKIPGKKKLTEKEECFCREFLVDLNGTAAARRCKYSNHTASAISSENLRKPHIRARIAELRTALGYDNNLAQRVVDELTRIGMSNIQDYLNADNTPKDFSTIDRELASAISGVKKSVTTFGDGEGNEGKKEVLEFKMWDKPAALEKLGRHLGIFELDNKQKNAVITVNVTDDDDG